MRNVSLASMMYWRACDSNKPGLKKNTSRYNTIAITMKTSRHSDRSANKEPLEERSMAQPMQLWYR